MKNSKCLLAILLLCGMILVSCGENASSGNTVSNTVSTENTAASEETLPEYTLPNENFEGKTITFLLRKTQDDWSADDVVAEEQDGSAINDAVYIRNTYVEDKYNFKIKGIEAPDNQPVYTPAINSILAGDHEFDIITAPANDSIKLMQEGYLLNLKKIPFISLEQSWWSPELSKTITIGGNQYYATGDISRVDNLGIRCFFFNKDIANDLILENPYEIVQNGDWTYEKLFSMAQSAVSDLNGDAKIDENDRYGIQAQDSLGMVLMYAGGVSISGKDESDMPIITVGDQMSLSIIDTIKNYLGSKDLIYYSNNWLKTQTRFTQNQALFQAEVILLIEALRASDVNIGIIPPPKYSEEQEKYISYLDEWCLNLYSLPINSTDPEFAGFVLEAMAQKSVDTLTPAFYDICLNGKYIRDNESSEMLDIIFSNYIMDNACSFGWGNLYKSITGAFKGAKDITSIVEKHRSKTETDLAKTIQVITDMQNAQN